MPGGFGISPWVPGKTGGAISVVTQESNGEQFSASLLWREREKERKEEPEKEGCLCVRDNA